MLLPSNMKNVVEPTCLNVIVSWKQGKTNFKMRETFVQLYLVIYSSHACSKTDACKSLSCILHLTCIIQDLQEQLEYKTELTRYAVFL